MRFSRRHNQFNLIEKDIKTLKPGDSTNPVREDEIFQISEFMIFLPTGSFEFSEENGITDIIESNNFYTIIDGDGKHRMAINKKKVDHIEFVLKNGNNNNNKGGMRKRK